MEKTDVLKRILEAAKLYKQNLVHKNMLIIFRDSNNSCGYFEVVFEPRQFQHLTGVKTADDFLAVDFFTRCIDNKLSVNDFEIENNWLVEKKMNVIISLMSINKTAKMVGDYKSKTHSTLLCTEKLVGGVRGCMGFIQDESGFLVPNTLLEADIRDVTIKGQQLMCIYFKDIKDKQYNCMCYLAKPLNPENVRWPKEIETKIDKENLVINFNREITREVVKNKKKKSKTKR